MKHNISFMFIGCGIPLLILLLSVLLIVGRALLTYPMGWNYPAANSKWHKAMERGDGEQAVYWAKKTVSYASSDREYESKLKLMLAYELNGDWEFALKIYNEKYGLKSAALERYKYGDLRDSSPVYNAHKITISPASIYYKMGDYSKAFECYGDIINTIIDNFKEKKTLQYGIDRDNHPLIDIEKVVYDTVMMRYFSFRFQKSLPFSDFHQFHEFMQKRYIAAASPEKYQEVMDLIGMINEHSEQLDNEIENEQ